MAPAKTKTANEFSPEEAKRRLDAALLGARIAGHKPMQSKPKPSPKAAKSPRRKPAKSGA